MKVALRDAVERVVELLVRGEYVDLERITGGRRLSASQLEEAVRQYGRTLRLPPDGQLKLDVIQVTGRMPPTWSTRCDLWTHEEGRSDLTLELTVVDEAAGPSIEIDNLHVL
jgi:hypothetical protein